MNAQQTILQTRHPSCLSRHSPLERFRTNSASQSSTAIVPAARPIRKPQKIFPPLCKLSTSLRAPEEIKVVVGVGEKVALIDAALAVIFLNIPVAVPKSADRLDDAVVDASLLESEELPEGEDVITLANFILSTMHSFRRHDKCNTPWKNCDASNDIWVCNECGDLCHSNRCGKDRRCQHRCLRVGLSAERGREGSTQAVGNGMWTAAN